MRALCDNSLQNDVTPQNDVISAPLCSTCDMSCFRTEMNQQAGQCYAHDNSGGNKMRIGVLCGIKNPFSKSNSQGTFKCC